MSNPALVTKQPAVSGTGSPQAFTNNTSSVTAGNIMLMFVVTYWSGGTATQAPASVVDNETVPNTYTRLLGQTPTATSNCRVDLYASPPLAATHTTNNYTVTVTMNAADTSGCEIGGIMTEWSGFGTSVGVDVSATAQTAAASSASIAMGSGSTQQAVEAIVTMMHFNDDTSPSGQGTATGTGTWIDLGLSASANVVLAFEAAYQLTSGTGTAYTATWSGLNTSTNNGGTAFIAALYPGASAPTLLGQICL